MRLRWCVLCVAAVALVGCGGRGRSSAPHGQPAAPKATAATQAALPEWAPENPSPEFLRAARVLKPLPLDVMKAEGKPDAENAARVEGAKIMWLAAYEFFGTLSDEQIDRFLQAKPSYLAIPIKQLTRKQRSALDRYFEAWRTAMRGRATADDPAFGDCVLLLYKMGAKRDLSNVLVGFDAGKHQGGGHFVHLCFHLTESEGDGFGSAFAQI